MIIQVEVEMKNREVGEDFIIVVLADGSWFTHHDSVHDSCHEEQKTWCFSSKGRPMDYPTPTNYGSPLHTP